MVITYSGIEQVKVQFGDTVLAFNPVSKNSKHKSGSFGADIALITVNHPDMDGALQASRGEKQAFAVTGPGEYEINGVFIKGLESKSLYGGEERINTIYSVNLENMNLCFLGALGSTELKPETISALDGIDILFIPIGGDGVLSPNEAEKLSVSLEPKVIIPIHYGEVGDKDALKKFLKEAGAEDVKPIDKLTVKRKDLEEKEGEIVVLEAQ
jgi:L-ascorbate metabolism protein UlaG (beta-lactamase superfamily)